MKKKTNKTNIQAQNNIYWLFKYYLYDLGVTTRVVVFVGGEHAKYYLHIPLHQQKNKNYLWILMKIFINWKLINNLKIILN